MWAIVSKPSMPSNVILFVLCTKVRWPYNSVFYNNTLKMESARVRNIGFEVSKEVVLIDSIIIVSFAKVRWSCDSVFMKNVQRIKAVLLRNVDKQTITDHSHITEGTNHQKRIPSPFICIAPFGVFYNSDLILFFFSCSFSVSLLFRSQVDTMTSLTRPGFISDVTDGKADAHARPRRCWIPWLGRRAQCK
jgi:hypothetical protein